MQVVLIRHGIAVKEGDERTRPLTKEGVEVTNLVAKNLLVFLPKADWIFDSGLARGTQTADIFKKFQPDSKRGTLNSLLPGQESALFIKDLQKYDPSAVIFLIGHEPDIGRHASYLLHGAKASFCAFRKAGVMWVEFEGLPAPSQGNLRCYIPPAISKFVQLIK